nr:immunoglobulin heavy chain junction region [Macaca mulatta]
CAGLYYGASGDYW